MSRQEPLPEELEAIRAYLSLPDVALLPADPLRLLSEQIQNLPPSLLYPFGEMTSPRDRASIRTIKSRRMIYASTTPKPARLRADAGRLRWPLLWERMGGSSLPPPSSGVEEEEDWVKDRFLGGGEREGGELPQHVKKLGGLLRGFEEEREMEVVRERKRAERRLDEVGEEFDSESDEEEEEDEEAVNGGGSKENGHATGVPSIVEEEDQESVIKAFEKKLLELFVDGLDTIPYDEIDFTEPPGGDVIAARDQEDRYFDEEDPSRTPNGHDEGKGELTARLEEEGMDKQNGQGDYDY